MELIFHSNFIVLLLYNYHVDNKYSFTSLEKILKVLFTQIYLKLR